MTIASPIRALLLDLDSTLLDESYVAVASFAACRDLAAKRPALDVNTLAAANAEEWEAYWPEIKTDWTLGRFDTAALRTEIWRRTLDRLGAADDASVALAVAVHHSHELRAYPLFDDVLPTLDAAAAAGVRLAVVTNGASDTQREKLEALGILEKWERQSPTPASSRWPSTCWGWMRLPQFTSAIRSGPMSVVRSPLASTLSG